MVAASAGIVAAFAAACGDDDEGATATTTPVAQQSTGTSTAAEVASTAATGSYKPVKPGLLQPQTGEAAERAKAAGAAAAKAAGGKVELPRDITIGFAANVGTAETSQRAQTVVTNAAKAFGWKVIATDAQGDPAKMSGNLATLVNKGVDAIIETALPVPVIQQQLKAATAKGIPSINVASATDPSPSLQAQYTFDLVGSEPLLNEAMARDLPKGSKIALLEVPLLTAYRPVVEKLKAFADEHGWDIVDSYDVDITDLQNGTTRATNTALTAHPDLDAIWIQSNPQPLAVVPVIQQRNKCGKVKLYAHIDEPSNLDFLRRGCLTAVSQIPLESNSLTAIDQLAEFFARKKDVGDFPADNAAATKEYGLNVFQTGVVSQDNVPPPGESLFPAEDSYTFFSTKWTDEFGVSL